jgi:putative endonuclease
VKKTTEGWCVYILKCNDGRLYTGMTNNIERRLNAHMSGNGARFTRAFGVKKLLYREEHSGRREALKREAEIKSWYRRQKLALIRSRSKR